MGVYCVQNTVHIITKRGNYLLHCTKSIQVMCTVIIREIKKTRRDLTQYSPQLAMGVSRYGISDLDCFVNGNLLFSKKVFHLIFFFQKLNDDYLLVNAFTKSLMNEIFLKFSSSPSILCPLPLKCSPNPP